LFTSSASSGRCNPTDKERFARINGGGNQGGELIPVLNLVNIVEMTVGINGLDLEDLVVTKQQQQGCSKHTKKSPATE